MPLSLRLFLCVPLSTSSSACLRFRVGLGAFTGIESPLGVLVTSRIYIPTVFISLISEQNFPVFCLRDFACVLEKILFATTPIVFSLGDWLAANITHYNLYVSLFYSFIFPSLSVVIYLGSCIHIHTCLLTSGRWCTIASWVFVL